MIKYLGRSIRIGAQEAVRSYASINKFERHLISRKEKWDLLYIPELYLQAFIASKITSNRTRVFVERSISGILGRENGCSLRPDICVTSPNLDKISVIEIKRVVANDDKIGKDLDKIEQYARDYSKKFVSGYLFVYTEGRGHSNETDMQENLQMWKAHRGCPRWKVILGRTQAEPKFENWCWGYCIFKYNFSHP